MSIILLDSHNKSMLPKHSSLAHSILSITSSTFCKQTNPSMTVGVRIRSWCFYHQAFLVPHKGALPTLVLLISLLNFIGSKLCCLVEN